MNDFFSKMNETLTNSENNVSITENGAVGYRTTGKKLVDMNFAVSSMRDMGEDAIRFRFAELFGEDEREAFGHLPAGHAVDFADGGDEAALAVLRSLFQDVGEIDHLDAGADFAAGARDLQHGYENIAFAADLGVDELVWGEEPGPVDEVGGFGGGGGDQTRLNFFFHGKRVSSLEKG